MNITVIGTINKDLILPFGDVPIESFGGIFYDITILTRLLPEARITPVSYLGEDVLPTVNLILDKMPHVNREALVVNQEKNHKVILEYVSPVRRNEKALFSFPALEWAHIEPYTDADMIIVNMITGWDLTLDAFKKLGEIAGDRLYLDLHFLATKVDRLGRRTPELPEHLSEWLAPARFVQMNEDEYATLSNGMRNEIDFFQKFFRQNQVLLVTKGSRGVTLIYQRDGMTGRRDFPGFKIPRMVDTTGCGDAFGAGYVVDFLANEDAFSAAEYGNLVAAANATMKGSTEAERLIELMHQIKLANTEEPSRGKA